MNPIKLRLSAIAILLFQYSVVIAEVAEGTDPDVDIRALANAVTLYASFDRTIVADFAVGDPKVYTQFDSASGNGNTIRRLGVSPLAHRIVKDGGKAHGALQSVKTLPRRGRLMFRAKDNLAYRRTGTSGSLSFWLKTNPNTELVTPYCDPIQITQKKASDGGLWIDFPKTTPRSLRLGAFKALSPNEKPIKDTLAQAPLVQIPNIGFKKTDWHHLAIVWRNLDSGKPNAHVELFIDGKSQGAIEKQAIAMKWDVTRTGIYFAINYIGMMDELAVFNRPLTNAEIVNLFETPVRLKIALLVDRKKAMPK